ncbi:MAG TPA: hypothetical protein VFZ09_23960 [Archangium sp.]|uniref:hypothetical protein n=1 Tax=Archangium sp. TaxID=1872627 RepID=UPI002E37DF98|nr:hypothetical protein [Archangium sp.]HEX5749306.1 hypothetical protein [Archangium sp.]
MPIHDLLNSGLLLIGSLQHAAESAGRIEEIAIWQHLRNQWNFTIITGQVYVFEDYLASLDSARTSYVSTAFNARADPMSQQGMTLLLRELDEQTDPARKQYTLVIIDLLNFIADSDQYEAFENYLVDRYSNPPLAIAFFNTRQEANAWLNSLSEPPSGGNVLIGDEYFSIWYSRESGFRELSRNDIVELFLDDSSSNQLPPVAASFNTREEALEWLTSHPASPMLLVTIAGERYHAVYHKKFNRHTLHSLTRLREERERIKAEQEQQEDQEAEPSED